MAGVTFHTFPKPWIETQTLACRTWIKHCGRADLTSDLITKNTYVCSKHFVGEKGPTEAYPHPVPCASTPERDAFLLKRSRKPPTPRQELAKRRRCQPLVPVCSEGELDTPLMDTPSTSQCSTSHYKETATTGTQTDLTITHIKGYRDEDLKDKGALKRSLLKEDVTKNDKSARFFTQVKRCQY